MTLIASARSSSREISSEFDSGRSLSMRSATSYARYCASPVAMIDDAIKPFEYGSPARSVMTICRLLDMSRPLDQTCKCFPNALAGDFVVDEDDAASFVQRAPCRDVDGRTLDLGEEHVVRRRRVERGDERRPVGEPV